MGNANFVKKILRASGNKTARIFIVLALNYLLVASVCQAEKVKEPGVSGAFYPDNKQQLSQSIDGFLNDVNPLAMEGAIFALILPHAGYSFSGRTAAFGYKLIKGKPYKTVVVIGPSHYYAFNGASVY
ncbi:MAG: AmmeMemoRadiSam system protein B, partial [Candidatus Omnitrophica bacterium]|nr:AmmeMemoRadiSam system protein B [Candidatus Omnitrophota bacterium]